MPGASPDPAVDERSTHSPARSSESDTSQFHNVKVGTPSTHHPQPLWVLRTHGCCSTHLLPRTQGLLWKRLWDRKGRGGGPGSDRYSTKAMGARGGPWVLLRVPW